MVPREQPCGGCRRSCKSTNTHCGSHEASDLWLVFSKRDVFLYVQIIVVLSCCNCTMMFVEPICRFFRLTLRTRKAQPPILI
jgi:hypothetical protein